MKNKPYLIGITGGSGSGKTSFIRKIRQQFSEKDLCILSQDDYYRPIDQQLKDEEGIENFDIPKSIDKKGFWEDIKKLAAGETVYKEEYTFNNENKSPKVLTIHSAPVIIIEGIFVFYFKKIQKELDLKVFLHAKENLKVIRRIKRDQKERNYPIDDVLYRYEHHVLPTFEKYIKPYQDEADLVINNNKDFEKGLDVFIGFLKNKLGH
jgi:uridine kinase